MSAKREMVEGGGCVAAAIKIAGQFCERLRYDSEAHGIGGIAPNRKPA